MDLQSADIHRPDECFGMALLVNGLFVVVNGSGKTVRATSVEPSD